MTRQKGVEEDAYRRRKRGRERQRAGDNGGSVSAAIPLSAVHAAPVGRDALDVVIRVH